MPFDHAAATRAHERSIFERFCSAQGLAIVAGSIEQPAPPAPDLSVEFLGAGRVSFELVRLDDADELAGMSLFRQAVDLIDREFANLARERRDALSRRLSDAEVTIHFNGRADTRQRREALPAAWQALEALREGFDGEVRLAKGVPDALEAIWVIRAEAGERPRFRAIATGSPLPIRVERIAEKLQKTYRCSEPLELLAYCHIGELAHITDGAAITDAVTKYLRASQFRRVWVYEGLLRRVALRFQAEALQPTG